MTLPLDKPTYADPERASGAAWVDAITAEIDAMSPMSEAQRKRTDQIGRLAGVLEDIREGGFDEKLGEEAIGWRFRDDFEELLDRWEAGRHPAQLARG